MLKFRFSLGPVLALCAVLVTACGGNNNSSGNASVRLINATTTHSSLSLLANSAVVGSATAADSVSAYVGVASGSPALQVNDGVTSAALATLSPSLGNGAHYALVAYENGGVVRTTVIAEDVAAPAAGTASLRIFNAATDAGPIDVYVTDPAANISTLDLAHLLLRHLDRPAGELVPVDHAGHLSGSRHRRRQHRRPAPRHPVGRADQHAGRLGAAHADDRRHAHQRRLPGPAGHLRGGAQHERARAPGRRGHGRRHRHGQLGRDADRHRRGLARGRRLHARAGGRPAQHQRQRRLGRRAGGRAHGGQRHHAADLRRRRRADGQPDRRRQPPAVGRSPTSSCASSTASPAPRRRR